MPACSGEVPALCHWSVHPSGPVWMDWDFASSDVFSGLQIDPDTLVKKLDLDSRSIISSRTGAKSLPEEFGASGHVNRVKLKSLSCVLTAQSRHRAVRAHCWNY
ncbi:protein FAM207A isoform X5 [Apteryx rowi]|uniref:protein FAM207A isoform X5 n=1 Tax=Apteryx rowi TaxID=308060 RepID=UPI000E1CC084|nr:protein FAM207A isoform X5 [Apteryx rowi]